MSSNDLKTNPSVAAPRVRSNQHFLRRARGAVHSPSYAQVVGSTGSRALAPASRPSPTHPRPVDDDVDRSDDLASSDPSEGNGFSSAEEEETVEPPVYTASVIPTVTTKRRRPDTPVPSEAERPSDDDPAEEPDEVEVTEGEEFVSEDDRASGVYPAHPSTSNSKPFVNEGEFLLREYITAVKSTQSLRLALSNAKSLGPAGSAKVLELACQVDGSVELVTLLSAQLALCRERDVRNDEARSQLALANVREARRSRKDARRLPPPLPIVLPPSRPHEARIRMLPSTLAKFRRLPNGSPLSRHDPLYMPHYFLNQVEQELLLQGNSPEADLGRMVSLLMHEESEKTWALKSFVSQDPRHLSIRQAGVRRCGSLVDYIKETFLAHFKMQVGGNPQRQAFRNLRWEAAWTLTEFLDQVQVRAAQAGYPLDGNEVIDCLLDHTPESYRRKLMEHQATEALTFALCQELLGQEDEITLALAANSRLPRPATIPSRAREGAPPSTCEICRGPRHSGPCPSQSSGIAHWPRGVERSSTPPGPPTFNRTPTSGGSGTTMPLHLWASKPDWFKHMNPDNQSGGCCFNCGARGCSATSPNCPAAAKGAEKKLLFERDSTAWRERVVAAGFDPTRRPPGAESARPAKYSPITLPTLAGRERTIPGRSRRAMAAPPLESREPDGQPDLAEDCYDLDRPPLCSDEWGDSPILSNTARACFARRGYPGEMGPSPDLASGSSTTRSRLARSCPTALVASPYPRFGVTKAEANPWRGMQCHRGLPAPGASAGHPIEIDDSDASDDPSDLPERGVVLDTLRVMPDAPQDGAAPESAPSVHMDLDVELAPIATSPGAVVPVVDTKPQRAGTPLVSCLAKTPFLYQPVQAENGPIPAPFLEGDRNLPLPFAIQLWPPIWRQQGDNADANCQIANADPRSRPLAPTFARDFVSVLQAEPASPLWSALTPSDRALVPPPEATFAGYALEQIWRANPGSAVPVNEWLADAVAGGQVTLQAIVEPVPNFRPLSPPASPPVPPVVAPAPTKSKSRQRVRVYAEDHSVTRVRLYSAVVAGGSEVLSARVVTPDLASVVPSLSVASIELPELPSLWAPIAIRGEEVRCGSEVAAGLSMEVCPNCFCSFDGAPRPDEPERVVLASCPSCGHPVFAWADGFNGCVEESDEVGNKPPFFYSSSYSTVPSVFPSALSIACSTDGVRDRLGSTHRQCVDASRGYEHPLPLPLSPAGNGQEQTPDGADPPGQRPAAAEVNNLPEFAQVRDRLGGFKLANPLDLVHGYYPCPLVTPACGTRAEPEGGPMFLPFSPPLVLSGELPLLVEEVRGLSELSIMDPPPLPMLAPFPADPPLLLEVMAGGARVDPLPAPLFPTHVAAAAVESSSSDDDFISRDDLALGRRLAHEWSYDGPQDLQGLTPAGATFFRSRRAGSRPSPTNLHSDATRRVPRPAHIVRAEVAPEGENPRSSQRAVVVRAYPRSARPRSLSRSGSWGRLPLDEVREEVTAVPLPRGRSAAPFLLIEQEFREAADALLSTFPPSSVSTERWALARGNFTHLSQLVGLLHYQVGVWSESQSGRRLSLAVAEPLPVTRSSPRRRSAGVPLASAQRRRPSSRSGSGRLPAWQGALPISSSSSSSGSTSWSSSSGGSPTTGSSSSRVAKRMDANEQLLSTEGRSVVPFLFRPGHTSGESPPGPWRQLLGFADTGCDVTQLSYSCARDLQSTLVEVDPAHPVWVILAGGRLAIRHQTWIEVQANQVLLRLRVNVAEQEDRFLCGEDILKPWGIALANIPLGFDATGDSEDEPDNEGALDEVELLMEPPGVIDAEGRQQLPAAEREVILAAIAEAVAANEAIPPGTLSSHPSAMVFLDTGSSAPIYTRPYGLPPAKARVVDEWLAEGLASGSIARGQPCEAWNLPILVASNKLPYGLKKRRLEMLSTDARPLIAECIEEGDLAPTVEGDAFDALARLAVTKNRVCADSRLINEVLLNYFANNLPKIDQIYDLLRSFRCVSAMDLRKGYNHCPIYEKDRHKLNFQWRRENFHFVGAPFGLKHLTYHFQSLMQTVLAGTESFALVYVDDIVVFSASPEEHVIHLVTVLGKLTQFSLKVSINKCFFGYSSLKILGHIIGAGGVMSIDPDKVRRLVGYTTPTRGKEVQELLGFTNFLRRFIPFCAKIEAPLNALRKAKLITAEMWTADCAQAFAALKTILTSPPVLTAINPAWPRHVAVDAALGGVGAMMFQVDPTSGERFYNGFVSQALNEHQRNYSATRRELLAIIFGLRRFHEHLYLQHFTLWTDHKSLIFMFTQKHLSYMLQDWFLVIMEYSFSVRHCPGVENLIPDHLSRLYQRRPDREECPDPLPFPAEGQGGSEGGNGSGQLPLGPVSHARLSRSQAAAQVLASSQQSTLAQVSEDSPGRMLEPLLGGDIAPGITLDLIREDSTTRSPSAVRNDDLLLWLDSPPAFSEAELVQFVSEQSGKRFVSRRGERDSLLRAVHERGHLSADLFYKHLFHVEGVLWPKMRQDCLRVVANCISCLRYNVGKAGFHPLKPLKVHEVWDFVALDTAEMPTSNSGMNFFLVMVCVACGLTVLLALRDKSGMSVAQACVTTFSLLGFPRVLQHDNGSEFVNPVLRALNEVTGMSSRQSAAYNPRSNGAVERRVGIAKRLVKKTCGGDMTNWDLLLPSVQFSINTTTLGRTGTTPYALMFNRSTSSVLPSGDRAGSLAVAEPLLPMSEEAILARNTQIRAIIHPAVFARSDAAKDKSAASFNRRHAGASQWLKPGASVMVRNLLKASKADVDYLGPFTVFEETRAGTFRLIDGDGKPYVHTVPADQLKATGPLFVAAEATAYEIDTLLDHRQRNGKQEFLVKWKNYPLDEASWEPYENFVDTAIVQEYWQVLQAHQAQGMVGPLAGSKSRVGVSPAEAASPNLKIRSKFPNRRVSRRRRMLQDAVELRAYQRAREGEPLAGPTRKRGRPRRGGRLVSGEGSVV